MQIGVGLDARLGLSFAQHHEMAAEAARLGYTSLWSPAGAAGLDSFHVCSAWHQASGLTTGISVVPSPTWTLALSIPIALVRDRSDPPRLGLGDPSSLVLV